MKCLILCGGKGSRLAPLTRDTPKPLTDVNGKPCLDYIVENLRQSGINQIILSLCHYPEKLVKYAQLNKLGYEIQAVDRGTAFALKKAAHLLTDPFLVCNGDTITNLNIKDMIEDFNLLKVKSNIEAMVFTKLKSVEHNGGTFIFTKGILDKIESGIEIPQLLTKLTWVATYNPEAYYYDIGDHERLEKARKELA